MYDQHEMTRDFYYTNQYLEMVMNYPKKKTRIEENKIGFIEIFFTCRIPAAVSGENWE